MKRLCIVGVLLASTAALAAAAHAGTTTTYHGTFGGPVVYTGCKGGTPPPATASGTWNVALHGSEDAMLSVDIFVDGKHHVSFGYGKLDQVAPKGDETFAATMPTQAGPLRVSVAGDTFVYRIAPYDLFGISCRAVTYYGTVAD